jgi:sarcosine oxidase
MPAIDVIVIGLGAIGSAALHELARRGRRVVGIERFSPGHDRGSSHGETRVIRLGYFEDSCYVPLVRAALPLWRELETRSQAKLLHVTGVIEIGAPDSELVRGTLKSAREHALPHEILKADALMQRYAAFRIPSHFVGVFQPDGGFLMAEAAVNAQVKLAVAAGAEIRTSQQVRAIAPRGGGVRVETDAGVIEAGAAIVAAGAWVKSLLPDLPAMRVTRQMLAWLAPHDADKFSRGRFPVFLLESEHGMHYGFPFDPANGFKVAKHHHLEEDVDPDHFDRTLTRADEVAIRRAIADYLPAANGALLAAKTCLYTMTPDGHFVLDHLPGHAEIVVASACSGHGFKFAPVLGQVLADLATQGRTAHDIARFRLARFQ